MSAYNLLKFVFVCPNCGNTSDVESEFQFGLLNLDTYSIGDRLRWNEKGRGRRVPKVRPEDGNYTGEAYVECPVCHQDYWLTVKVFHDMIASVDVDFTRKGYKTGSANRGG